MIDNTADAASTERAGPQESPLTPSTHLDGLTVPLANGAAQAWHNDFGIVGVYLNDIALGVLIEVPRSWSDSAEATNRVARGLRRIRQELWRLNLVRPVLAVFWPQHEDTPSLEALRTLTWDQEAHRGDFALREAASRKAAEALLWALMGDTMGALDDSAREDRIGIPETMEAFKKEFLALRASSTEPWGPPGERLAEAILDELGRAHDTHATPDLITVVEQWLRAEVPR